jgi:eukaryotic-like serine/threonine-protein kinase
LALDNKKEATIPEIPAKNTVIASRKFPKFTWKGCFIFAVAPLLLGLLIFSPRIWSAIKALNYYTEGNSLIDQEKYEEAIVAFDRAIKVQPNFTQAWTNKGFAQGKLGKSLDKFASCAQATNVAPDFAEAWNCRGLARQDLLQYDAALKEYDQAISVDETFYRAWFNKGQVYLKLGDREEAIAATKKVLALEPEYYLAWTQICQAYFELGQYQEAQEYCEESLAISRKYQPTIDLLEQIKAKLQ